MDAWRENVLLRIVVVLALLAVAAFLSFGTNIMTPLGGMAGMARWGTMVGFTIAGLSLILTPILEDQGL